MTFKTLIIRIILSAFLTLSLTACGGGSSKKHVQEPPAPVPVGSVPINTINHAYFRDQDGATSKLAGTVHIEGEAARSVLITTDNIADSLWLYWADGLGNVVGNTADSAWLKTDSASVYDITIPVGTNIPANISAFIIYPHNAKGLALTGTLIKFHDFIGNAQLSGPGGNEHYPWYYGQPPASNGESAEFTVLRDTISIHRSESQGGLCIFDNGLVSIIDMAYTKDEAWEAGKGSGPNAQANEANDSLFPIYQAPCAANPINTHRWVGDRAEDTDDGIEYVWTYSTINDAMFYGTLVYDTFVKYLGEPPLEEKLRIRLHYGHRYSAPGYWDGAYATFGDAYPFQYSTSSLDSIGHEFGHGVLNRLMGVDFFLPSNEFSKAFRTLHEAFSDISGVMAWYEYGQLKGESTLASIGAAHYWKHGEENRGQSRKLDRIVTEYNAIDSMLDYDEAEGNYYLSIGMFTYPFYLLSQQWGMEAAYGLYIDAARNCWTSTMTHTQIAQCLKQRTELLADTQKVDDVIAAFKTVKIKLFDEGILSHFQIEISKLRTQFTDNSRSTSQVSAWHWDFGDGTTSQLQSPQHTYATAGDYQVKLTVDDSLNHNDDFTRIVSVTDQYCDITSGYDAGYDIGQAVINGLDLNFDAEQWDYSAIPIALIGPNNKTLTLDITGASNAAIDETISWTVWLDINDDGIYSRDEMVHEETIAIGESYGTMISEDLTDFITAANVTAVEGQAEIVRYMRVIGEHTTVGACSSAVGEAFDVRVTF